jgi:predicted dehydrogenase
MATRHRIGFIGCGGMARGAHLPRFAAIKGTAVVAVTEPAPAMREALVRKCAEIRIPVPVMYDDYREMLDREELDIVAIVTPHTQHFAQAAAALKQGLHILMEKPMVTTVAEARTLARLVAHSGRVFSIAYPGAFSVHHRAVRKFIAEGGAGRIKTAALHVMQGGWLVGTRGSWRQDPKQSGGGQFYDTGSHLLNSLIWILDDSVAAVSGFMSREGSRVDINGALSFRMRKGTLAAVMIGGHGAARCVEEIVFFGDKATVRTGIWGGRLEVTDIAGKPIKIKLDRDVPLQQTFIDVVDGKRPNPAPVKYGLYISGMMDKIYRSVVTVNTK